MHHRSLRDRYLTPTVGAAEYRSALEGTDKSELRVAPLELRDVDGLKLAGRAIVFDTPSVDMGGWREIIKRGALRSVLATQPDVRLLLNHEGMPFARTKSGTLSIKEQPQGLDWVAELPDTPFARALVLGIERGDIDQMSFAFRVAIAGSEWEYDEESGLDIRIVHKISRLSEISIVTFPAYEETSVAAKRDQDDPQQEDATDRERTVAPGTAEERSTDLETTPAAGASRVDAARRARLDLLSRS